jgi:hypothetical protein
VVGGSTYNKELPNFIERSVILGTGTWPPELRKSRSVRQPRSGGGVGGPLLTIFVYTIPTEGAPSLRFLQG